jgi:hypothetical protein
MTTSHLTNGNGHVNVNGNGNGHAAKDPSRYWIKPYVPNQGESFEVSTSRRSGRGLSSIEPARAWAPIEPVPEVSVG